MPIAGRINVTPLEEKASEEEPVVYANKLVRMTHQISKLRIRCLFLKGNLIYVSICFLYIGCKKCI
jgi:hypothetical protein